MLIFFSLRISATPILVLTTESAILNTPTKGTDVFAHLATLEKTARKVNVSRVNTNLHITYILLMLPKWAFQLNRLKNTNLCKLIKDVSTMIL